MRRHDAIGIGLSGLCLIHCLALPVLISVSPALFWIESEWTHLGLAMLALLVSVIAMRNWVAGARGMVLRWMAAIAVGLLFYGALADISELTEQGVTIAGAILLALSHSMAWIAARSRGAHRH